MSLPTRLGPACLGLRVVVRRALPGETGPSGGPAMTDVLGTLQSWTEDHLVVRHDDGTLVRIERAHLVSGKAVPPRPSVRHRVPAEEAARRALGSWPAGESRRLGEWLLRASSGFSARGNSVLLTGDPQVPWQHAVAEVVAFYAERGLPPWAQVIVGSADAARAEAERWQQARPGEADSLLQVASVAQVVRRSREALAGDAPRPTITERLTEGWLASDDRARAHPAAARRVLEGPDHVAFATVVTDGAVVARARAAMPEGDDWVGITDVWVDPQQRGNGLGVAVLAAVLPWAAERGASTAYLQVRADNVPALGLYGRMSFVTHHAYRYLRAPDGTGVTGR